MSDDVTLAEAWANPNPGGPFGDSELAELAAQRLAHAYLDLRARCASLDAALREAAYHARSGLVYADDAKECAQALRDVLDATAPLGLSPAHRRLYHPPPSEKRPACGGLGEVEEGAYVFPCPTCSGPGPEYAFGYAPTAKPPLSSDFPRRPPEGAETRLSQGEQRVMDRALWASVESVETVDGPTEHARLRAALAVRHAFLIGIRALPEVGAFLDALRDTEGGSDDG